LYQGLYRYYEQDHSYDMFGFFFSSRRRHTRCYRDWSSDVCSSDLSFPDSASRRNQDVIAQELDAIVERNVAALAPEILPGDRQRSEERRVGKECRCGWWACDETKKI